MAKASPANPAAVTAGCPQGSRDGHSVWYSLRDLPAGRVRVRVRWEARVFEAARALNPQSKRLEWCVVERGEIVWLPRKEDRARWEPEPDSWQPIDPEAWTWPGDPPPPLVPQVRPVMISQSGSRRWASMAEQAAEAERIRAEALAAAGLDHDEDEYGGDPGSDPGGRLPAGQSPGSKQRWWLDDTQITYSDPGQITRREAEGRLMRGILADGVTPRRRTDAGLVSAATGIGAMVADVISSDDRVGAERFQPTPRDIADHLTVMGWFAALNPLELRGRRAEPWGLSIGQRALVWRALGHSWRQIGRHLGISHVRAKQIVVGGSRDLGLLAKVERAANRQRVHQHMPVVDQIEALRARNRAAKRRQEA